jgi:hypothetical protein
MHGLEQGDDDAAAEVFQLYANRLDSRIQQTVDHTERTVSRTLRRLR